MTPVVLYPDYSFLGNRSPTEREHIASEISGVPLKIRRETRQIETRLETSGGRLGVTGVDVLSLVIVDGVDTPALFGLSRPPTWAVLLRVSGTDTVPSGPRGTSSLHGSAG